MGFIKFIQDGGFFMYPILLVGILGVAIVVERLIYLTRVKSQNAHVWKHIQPLLQKGDIGKIGGIVKTSPSEVARSIEYGLAAVAEGGDESHVANAFEEGLLESIPRIEQRTSYVVVIANVSTLIGLLGTVHGLNQAFKSVASADPAEKGDLLAAAIAIAMNCTAAGLMFAIPLLLAYAFLSSYTQQIVDSIEMISTKVQNKIRSININH